MRRREFLSKIGAVLATASTAATLAKAGDVKSWKDKQPPSRIQMPSRWSTEQSDGATMPTSAV